MSDVIQRGNTVFFSFVFLDQNRDVTAADSAEVELTFVGRDGWTTETVTLELTSGSWQAEWDSSKARAGWVRYHAHALSDTGGNFASDGRFKVRANIASYQHDLLPAGNGLNDTAPTDYVS